MIVNCCTSVSTLWFFDYDEVDLHRLGLKGKASLSNCLLSKFRTLYRFLLGAIDHLIAFQRGVKAEEVPGVANQSNSKLTELREVMYLHIRPRSI